MAGATSRPRWTPALRTRLVAVAVALVAFAVATTGTATYLSLRGFLYDRIDGQLAQILKAQRLNLSCSGQSLGIGPPGLGPGIRGEGAQLAYYGVVLLGKAPGCSFSLPLNLTSADAARLAATAGGPITVRGPDGARYRAVAQPRTLRFLGYFSPGTPVEVAIGLPTRDADSTLGKLLALELIVGAVAVAGTAALGAVGVRLGLRPLDRVTRTARAVAAELSPDGTGLDRRVPAADPRTEVGQLAEAVNTMLEVVELEYAARYESEQRMRRFLADASHELRTPLTSLRGYAELIRLRGGDGFDPSARDSLRRIESEGDRMARLVENLLTLARHDRGTAPRHEHVDLADVVDDAVAGLTAGYPEREVSVEIGAALSVLGDRDQLLEVVGNVLTNAAVHATGGGPIAVIGGRRNGHIVVEVVDTGPGLTPDQAAHAFERFWRADAGRTRARGGSGLGLAIVAALVDAHRGTVGFASSVAEGTTVTVSLPAADSGDAAAVEPAGAVGGEVLAAILRTVRVAGGTPGSVAEPAAGAPDRAALPRDAVRGGDGRGGCRPMGRMGACPDPLAPRSLPPNSPAASNGTSTACSRRSRSSGTPVRC